MEEVKEPMAKKIKPLHHSKVFYSNSLRTHNSSLECAMK